MDTNWDQDKLQQSDLQGKVGAIHLVAYPNPSNKGDEEGLPPTNHWCLFLEIGPQSSVRLDMAPGYGSDGLRGKIQISSKNYTCTTNTIHTLSYPVIAQVNVKAIVDLVERHGRQKYQFTPEWEGCRFWNYIFLQDLEKEKIVSPDTAKKAGDAMSWYYRTPRGTEKREMRVGTFRA